MHAFDRRTDRQTAFSSLDRVCIPCSAVKKTYNSAITGSLIFNSTPEIRFQAGLCTPARTSWGSALPRTLDLGEGTAGWGRHIKWMGKE